MQFTAATYGLGLVAGSASVLSPCVLPLLPILATSALAKHRFGIIALAAGLAISFAGVGIFLATLGASAGLDPEILRRWAAGLMVFFGLVMLSGTLQGFFSRLSSVVGAKGQQALDDVKGNGLLGQTMMTVAGVRLDPLRRANAGCGDVAGGTRSGPRPNRYPDGAVRFGRGTAARFARYDLESFADEGARHACRMGQDGPLDARCPFRCHGDDRHHRRRPPVGNPSPVCQSSVAHQSDNIPMRTGLPHRSARNGCRESAALHSHGSHNGRLAENCRRSMGRGPLPPLRGPADYQEAVDPRYVPVASALI